MNKIEFKKLDKEQMIIAFNQLKDDYKIKFNKAENLQQRIDKVINIIENVIKIWETKPNEIATLSLKELLSILKEEEKE